MTGAPSEERLQQMLAKKYGRQHESAWAQVSLPLREPARNRKTGVDLQVD